MYANKVKEMQCGTVAFQKLDQLRMLLMYGVTWLAWGAIAES